MAEQTTATLTLPAQPCSVELNLPRTAVIVVDMLNDFCTPGGSLDTAGFDLALGRSVIRPISDLLALARELGLLVIYLKHGYQPDLSDLGPPASRNAIAHAAAGVGRSFATPDGSTGRIGILGTWNTEIIDELAPAEQDVIVSKSRFSGFYRTSLDSVLAERGIDTVLVTGLTTSVCVEATVRDAMYLDYRPVVLADCTAEPQGQRNHEASLTIIASTLGWVSDAASLTSAVHSKAASAAEGDR